MVWHNTVGGLIAGVLLTSPVMAQTASDDPSPSDDPKPTRTAVIVTPLLGIKSEPSYKGASTSSPGVAFSFDILHFQTPWLTYGDNEIPDDPMEHPNGFVPRFSVRYESARRTKDHPELAGLNDIDHAFETGFGVGWVVNNIELAADVRYGVLGHKSLVGELSGFYVQNIREGRTLRIGGRARYGSERYMNTYFGVSSAESARSRFGAYAPSAGLVSLGLEAIYSHELKRGLWLEAQAVYDRLQGEAANSPIVQNGSADQFTFSLGVRRAFSFRF